MDGFTLILALSLIIQFVVERIKTPIPNPCRSWAVPLIVFLISLGLSFCCRASILTYLGIAIKPPWIDYIITGIILSGGSTLMNELIKALNSIKVIGQQTVSGSLLGSLVDSLGEVRISVSEDSVTSESEEGEESAKPPTIDNST